MISAQSVLNVQQQAAYVALDAEEFRASPHVILRVSVYPDGDKWCALYGVSLQEGVAGFGDTPAAACADFDKNWRSQSARS